LKPVVSAKYNLWGGFETGESLAQKLNNAVRDPYSVEGYTLVAVHAWSNSVDSLLYVNSLLEEGVRVVAPDEFVSLISDAICGQEGQDELRVVVFPNPFQDEIQFRVEGYPSNDFDISIEDMNGKSVSLEIVSTETFDGWIFDMRTQGLSKGTYIFRFATPDENKMIKIFKYD